MISLQITHAASATATASAQLSVVPSHLILNGVKVLDSADKMPSKGCIGLHFEKTTQTLTIKLYTSTTFDTVEKFEIRDHSLFTTIKDAIDSGNHDEVKKSLLSIRSTYPSLPKFAFEDSSTQFKIILPQTRSSAVEELQHSQEEDTSFSKAYDGYLELYNDIIKIDSVNECAHGNAAKFLANDFMTLAYFNHQHKAYPAVAAFLSARTARRMVRMDNVQSIIALNHAIKTANDAMERLKSL
jgi:hypothetical protein